MIAACRRPRLVLEGEGDREAVPHLLRKIAEKYGIWDFNCAPHPALNQNLPRLANEGELEKFVQYALSDDRCDSLLICVDSDNACPRDAATKIARRLAGMHLTKKVGLCLFRAEFESLFILCLDMIAESYKDCGWKLEDWNSDIDAEGIRGAKEWLSRRMKKGKAYKETRDQARFVSRLDLDRLSQRSRSFQHLEKTMTWLLGLDGNPSSFRPSL